MRFRKFQALLAVLVVAASIGAAVAVAADPAKPGAFTGRTGQGKPIKLVVERSGRDRLIRRITVRAKVFCEGGQPPEQAEIINRLVFGTSGKIKNGRFRLQYSDLDIRGRVVTPRRIEGRFDMSAEFSPCDVENVGYHVINR